MYLLSPGYSWKIAYLGFNYNHSLTLLLLQVIHWKNTVTRWQKMFKWYGRLILKIITKMVDYGSSSMEKFMMFRNLDYLPNVERAIWKSMLVGFSKKNKQQMSYSRLIFIFWIEESLKIGWCEKLPLISMANFWTLPLISMANFSTNYSEMVKS